MAAIMGVQVAVVILALTVLLGTSVLHLRYRSPARAQRRAIVAEAEHVLLQENIRAGRVQDTWPFSSL